jgi:hypothetical protein
MQSPQNMVMRRLAVVDGCSFSSFVGALVGTAVIVVVVVLIGHGVTETSSHGFGRCRMSGRVLDITP